MRSLKVTFPEIRGIVATNEKQRFSLIRVPSASSVTTTAPSSATPTDVPLTVAATDAAPDTSDPSDADPANFLIRATQGHSIAISSEGLLTPITGNDPDLPDTVVHGTTHQAWPLILKSGGLKRMKRNHVHFAAGLPKGFAPVAEEDVKAETAGKLEPAGVAAGAEAAPDTAALATTAAESSAEQPQRTSTPPVISSMRTSSTILVYVDLPAAMAAGLEFWRSENGVVLSEGDENGVVPLKFFKRVEERTRGGSGRVVVRDGQVVAEVEERGGGGWGRGRGRGMGRGRGA